MTRVIQRAVGIAALGGLLHAAPPVRFELQSTKGVRRSSSEVSQYRATVLVFLAVDCPISNRYSPLLHQLETKYTLQKVRFLGVFSAPDSAAASVRQHLTDYGLTMEGLLDPMAALARQTGARITPEAVILSSAGMVVYRGRIDNRFVAWGQTRSKATRKDLEEALDAVLVGAPVPHPYTKALGCSIPGL